MAAADDLLVWVDLEMTGLDPDRDVIVEIACIVTDGDLVARDDGIDIVIHQPPEALAAMDDFVRTMHTKSALLPAIEAATTDVAQAEAETLAYVQAHIPEARRTPLCGNSIGTDRRFLAKYMPTLDGYLHYRSVDVSSIKELCRRWYPKEYRERPVKAETHRALDDIIESIAELRFYREAIFKPTA
jgi:oligoribonuclease